MMLKSWIKAECNFNYKTFVEITFSNSESDFRQMRYPTIGEAIKDQKRKLCRDIVIRAGKENMDEIAEAIR
jgi:uncharacterized membrane protein